MRSRERTTRKKRPWSGEDLPKLEAWLEKNETKSDQVAAASLLPQVWLSTPVALAEWRLDQRDEASMCLERLDELVPQYHATIPVDSFSERPFIYERRGSGYLLASVGSNGVYDGGDDEDGEM